MNLSSVPPRRRVEDAARIPILTLVSVWRLAMEDPLRVDEADAMIKPAGRVCSTFRSCSFCLSVCVCVFSRSVLPDSLRPHGLSLPGSSVHGILQARVLEWAAIPFSRGCLSVKDIRITALSCH